jgi:hypothetical protein
LGQIQLVLTRNFKRENPSLTGPVASSTGFDQRVSQLKLSSTPLKKLNSAEEVNSAEKAQLTSKCSTQLKKLNSAEKGQKSSTAFQHEHYPFLNPNNRHTQSVQRILVFKIAFEFRGLSFGKHLKVA